MVASLSGTSYFAQPSEIPVVGESASIGEQNVHRLTEAPKGDIKFSADIFGLQHSDASIEIGSVCNAVERAQRCRVSSLKSREFVDLGLQGTLDVSRREDGERCL